MHTPFFSVKPTTQYALQALLLISVVITIYLPGLTGPFMLDDFGSLPTLYDTLTQQGFWYAVFDGSAGPTGRPISLFSFALQHSQWQEPYYFKLVNVLIHAINTVLVFWLTHLIIQKLPIQTNKNRALICFAITLVWALHPIQISTVLYVVQRMVLLSSTFVLLGCISYIYGRINIEKEKLRKGYSLTTLGIVFFGSLALLSKEVGFQIILYILCIETVLFTTNNLKKPKLFFYWRHTFITLPIIVFVSYLFTKLDQFAIGYEIVRHFSMDERVLTQTKVLWEYIAQILFPRVSELGLYHDNYPPLRSWLSPISMVSVITIVALFISSVLSRQKLPVFSFAILWFLLGHSMEASFIPLELYFEHRNYLPSLGIILGSVFLLFSLSSHVKSGFLKQIYLASILLAPVLIIGLTYQQTQLWGNSLSYAVIQAKEHPDSVRARSLMVGELSNNNRLEQAYIETKKMKQQFQLTSVALLEAQFACVDPSFPVPDINDLRKQIAKSKLEMASMSKLSELIEDAINGDCDALHPDYLLSIVDAFELNAAYSTRENDLITFRAVIYMELKGDISNAIQSLLPDNKLEYDNRILLARYLATATEYQTALTVLNNAKKTLSNSFKDRSKLQQATSLESIIRQDIANQLQNIE